MGIDSLLGEVLELRLDTGQFHQRISLTGSAYADHSRPLQLSRYSRKHIEVHSHDAIFTVTTAFARSHIVDPDADARIDLFIAL